LRVGTAGAEAGEALPAGRRWAELVVGCGTAIDRPVLVGTTGAAPKVRVRSLAGATVDAWAEGVLWRAEEARGTLPAGGLGTGPLGTELLDVSDPSAGWCAGDSARPADAQAGAERTTPARA
jgi:hypothetical protein